MSSSTPSQQQQQITWLCTSEAQQQQQVLVTVDTSQCSPFPEVVSSSASHQLLPDAVPTEQEVLRAMGTLEAPPPPLSSTSSSVPQVSNNLDDLADAASVQEHMHTQVATQKKAKG